MTYRAPSLLCVDAPSSTRYLRLKRVMDLIAAAVLLVILSPLLAAIAILVRFDSKGPAIYRQPRVGRHKKPFVIYKFRTMRVGTRAVSTEEMRTSGADPFTRIGPFLRTTSLDELPQLVNIIRGDMSFIGPRPALPSQGRLNGLRDDSGVHSILPGITGLAQVYGRDDLDDETKVRYDAEYLHNLTLAQDIRILWLTIGALITARGTR
jgi:lipopolysaccharide/colanic/teichoic acid biosynthesis glycosyltransferase